MGNLYLFTVLCSLVVAIVIGQHVPVIGWANTRSLANTPTIPAGHFVTAGSLRKDYLDRIVDSDPHTICIFVINKLSIDDITKYSDAYNEDSKGSILANLRNAMESSKYSLVLPHTDSSGLGSYISSKVDGQVLELSEPSLKNQALDKTKTNVIIFQLKTANSNNREEEIRKADKLLGDVTSELNAMSAPYTALLTAQQSPVKPKEDATDFQETLKFGRQILSTEDSEEEFVFANFTEDACEVYFYSKFVNVTFVDGSIVSLTSGNWPTTGSNCSKDKVFLVMSATSESTNSSGANYEFEFDISLDKYGFWNINKANLTVTNDTENYTEAIDMSFVETPERFSYHCIESKAVTSKDDKTKRIASVTYTDFQIQPFNIVNHEFSFPNDCIGFFTEGIWMGLVTAFIIILILAFGFGMLASLSVMDRFDDPKGKTITIPQTSD